MPRTFEEICNDQPWLRGLHARRPLESRCPACRAGLGETHEPNCPTARCARCGYQRLSCPCGGEGGPDRWVGTTHPEDTRVALEQGFYCRCEALDPQTHTWRPATAEDLQTAPRQNVRWNVPCGPDDEGAAPDLTAAQKFLRLEKIFADHPFLRAVHARWPLQNHCPCCGAYLGESQDERCEVAHGARCGANPIECEFPERPDRRPERWIGVVDAEATRVALEQRFYCCPLALDPQGQTWQPVSPADFQRAQQEGRRIRWDVPCNPNDPHAVLDLERADRFLTRQARTKPENRPAPDESPEGG